MDDINRGVKRRVDVERVGVELNYCFEFKRILKGVDGGVWGGGKYISWRFDVWVFFWILLFISFSVFVYVNICFVWLTIVIGEYFMEVKMLVKY